MGDLPPVEIVMLEDGLKDKEAGDNMRVLELAGIVAGMTGPSAKMWHKF